MRVDDGYKGKMLALKNEKIYKFWTFFGFVTFLYFLADKCTGSSNETFKIVHAVLTVNL